ncbi:hypothetical protein FKP32DRAFT_293091 [Trametes sanguinea]|nr:hypothetical protein FKP32DRAFT_293091 [Trametes sanguinea]
MAGNNTSSKRVRLTHNRLLSVASTRRAHMRDSKRCRTSPRTRWLALLLPLVPSLSLCFSLSPLTITICSLSISSYLGAGSKLCHRVATFALTLAQGYKVPPAWTEGFAFINLDLVHRGCCFS